MELCSKVEIKIIVADLVVEFKPDADSGTIGRVSNYFIGFAEALKGVWDDDNQKDLQEKLYRKFAGHPAVKTVRATPHDLELLQRQDELAATEQKEETSRRRAACEHRRWVIYKAEDGDNPMNRCPGCGRWGKIF